MVLKAKIKEIDWNKIKGKILALTKIFLCRLRKFFSVKTFSKGQMLIFCFIIVWGSFLYKDFFHFIWFLGGTLIGWFTGYMGLKHVQRVLERAERIIDNPLIPIDKKYVEAVGAVHTSVGYLGKVMDKYNLKQGTAPYLKDLKEKIGGEKKSG